MMRRFTILSLCMHLTMCNMVTHMSMSMSIPMLSTSTTTVSTTGNKRRQEHQTTLPTSTQKPTSLWSRVACKMLTLAPGTTNLATDTGAVAGQKVTSAIMLEHVW